MQNHEGKAGLLKDPRASHKVKKNWDRATPDLEWGEIAADLACAQHIYHLLLTQWKS